MRSSLQARLAESRRQFGAVGEYAWNVTWIGRQMSGAQSGRVAGDSLLPTTMVLSRHGMTSASRRRVAAVCGGDEARLKNANGCCVRSE
jgi:hypothetical protein